MHGTVEAQEPAVRFTPPLPPPSLTIERTQLQLIVSGDVSSLAHEARMRQLATSLVPGLVFNNELRLHTALPPGWALVTEMVLRATAETYAANARIDEKLVSIRGFTLDQDAWLQAARQIQDSLLPGMRFQQDVENLRPGVSFEQQCHELLIAVSSHRPIEFSHASDKLKSSAFALLDGLVETATDCPAVAISVTGHTDSSGDEAGNRALSKARADSVVAYLVANGIAASRLQSFGVGSSKPLVEEDSVRARQQNRRIEFEFSIAARAN